MPGPLPYGQPGPEPAQPARPARTPSQKRAFTAKAVMAGGLAIVLLLLLANALGVFRSSSPVRLPPGTDSGLRAAALKPPAGTAPALDVRAVLRAVEPGVVDITIGGASAQTQGQGTGMVLDTQGDVLTNAHVVAGGGTVTVQIFGDPAIYPAHVLSAATTADVAVIKIDNPPAGLHPVPLGKSSGILVGDPVVAVGNALGLSPGGPTVTSGIIAALNRTLDTGSGRGGTEHLTGLIQTDAPLNPGNSGGPLIDANATVIGMNTAVATSAGLGSAQNIGFAIPIDVAMQLVPSLEKGTVPPSTQGFLGVNIQSVATGGAQVASVTPGSPAANAGLRAGDVITALDGQPVASSGDVADVIGALGPGSKVTVTYQRGGASHTVTVILATRPANASPSPSP